MYGMWFLENGVVVFVKQTIMAMVIGSIIIVFLLFPQAVSDSAKEGLLMWFQIVLPSLLPFSIVSSVIMGLGLTERITGVVAPVLQRVFGITRSGCYAVVVGMLSGYPLGAATTAELYRGQRICKEEAQYILTFCNNASPMFLTEFIGVSCMGLHKPLIVLILVRVPWKLTSDEKTVYGYYEKVNPGQHLKGNLKPTFVIDEAKTAANGGEHPVFRQAHVDEKAQYIWVSMSDSQDAGYKNHKATENVKFASGTTAAVMNSKYKVGDREYTSRTGQVYQYQTQWENNIDIGTTKMYFYDDFLRYSLRLRSRYEVENYNIVFKTIEPWELNEHPEWLDYADMILPDLL